MQIADWISHPGSSTPIHYLNAKVNAFIFSTGVVPPARPPPECPILVARRQQSLGRGLPWTAMAEQRGEPSPLRGCHQHPWGRGAKAERQGGMGDVGLYPTPSYLLLPAPGPRCRCYSPTAKPWELVKGAGLPLSKGRGSVCVQRLLQEELGPSWLL